MRILIYEWARCKKTKETGRKGLYMPAIIIYECVWACGGGFCPSLGGPKFYEPPMSGPGQTVVKLTHPMSLPTHTHS